MIAILERSPATADAGNERPAGKRRGRRRWRRRAVVAAGSLVAVGLARRLLARRREASIPSAGDTARVDRAGDAGGGSGLGGKLAGLLAVVGIVVLLRAVRRRL